MNCSSCGTDLPSGASVCPVCGTPTPYNAPGPDSPQQIDPTVLATPYGAPPPPPMGYGSPSVSAPQGANPYEPLQANPYGVVSPPPYPYGTPPQQAGGYGIEPPQPKRRRRIGLIIAIVALVLILSCVGIFAALYQIGKQNLDTQATATAQTRLTTIASNYPFSSAVVLNDPLSNNSQGHRWDEITYKTGGTCKFEGQSYHALQLQSGYFNTCYAAGTDFSNFTYQVQMTIIQGDAGGILFRADGANTKFYYLRLQQDGSYALYLYVDATATDSHTLITGTASNFNTGLNQSNLVGVVAKGDNFSIYVNKQEITNVTDTSYSHGEIGVTAEYIHSTTDVSYTNAEVWSL